MPQTLGRVAIVVLTYLRNAELAELLPMLDEQIEAVAHDDIQIIVIDNDPAGSAAETVRRHGSTRVRYVHEPGTGIVAARNRALDETAKANILIFIDDDERPMEGWLDAMLHAYLEDRPAGVTGPLYPEFEIPPERWLVEGGFFVRPHYPRGHHMPAAGSGNLLLDLDQVRALGLRFDERFSVTGGSDNLFTRQLIQRGGVIEFAPAAAVLDKVPASRMSRTWILRRHYRMGTTWSRASIELVEPGFGRLVSRLGLTWRGAARVSFGALRSAYGLATGSLVHQVRGRTLLGRGLGMVAGAWGGVYEEYRRPTEGQA